MFDDLRARVGAQRSPKRYHSGDHNDLEEVSNPRTLEDESRTSWYERFHANRWNLLVWSLFIFLLGLVVLIHLGRLGPSLLNNKWFREFLKIGVPVAITWHFTTKSTLARILGLDWLVAVTREGVEIFVGEYVTTDSGSPAFEPVKGFTWRGHLGRKYELQEFSQESTLTWSKQGWAADDPVRIRLFGSMSEVSQTDYGTIVGVLGGKIEPDHKGRETTHVVTLPDEADPGRLDELRVLVEDLDHELHRERGRIDDLEELVQQYREDLKKARSEQIREFTRQVQRLGLANNSRGRRRQEDHDLRTEGSEGVAPVEEDRLDDLKNDVEDDQ